MKARTRRLAQRAERKKQKAPGMTRPGGKSKYAAKDRPRERARGYSRRKTSPFFMSAAEVTAARATAVAEVLS